MVKGPRKLAKPTRGGHLEMKRWWWANMHTSNYGVIKMRSETTTRTQLWWWILERLLWRNYKSKRRKYHNIGVKYYWTFTFKWLQSPLSHSQRLNIMRSDTPFYLYFAIWWKIIYKHSDIGRLDNVYVNPSL